MMSGLDIGAAILQHYPEQNFFDANPPLPNLSPFSLEIFHSNDTPELLAACRDMVAKSGLNPLSLSYGTNLLDVREYRLFETHYPLEDYQKPPPLQMTSLPKEAVLMEQLNKRGNTLMFTVRLGEEIRLLKIFTDRDTIDWPNWQPPYDPEAESCVEYDPFEGEKEAYAHLQHYGTCDKGGIVPRCYGWLQLDRGRMEEILALPNIAHSVHGELQWRKVPLDALLLEYFPGARQLTHDVLTEKLADKAMRALYEVHRAYVVHGDVHPRNILVLPDKRVILVDFNRARCPSGMITCRRQELLRELSDAWAMFYRRMLPDKRIGLVPSPPEDLTPTDEL
ncbi:uncharacterized protein PHACADRAFT_178020 [Phanerochaete carnosa HHB-10118-sp]|uniref:Uncharacterized protein n=1 Tax=Phanerochaete carnosa (strain HHB-10118-sp) TaxID=650164 RepID=K5VX70_PHACS|nr:uncharacterized protein PHACADRAFT_178020 [Phanerochaete carnosa HHB-10118-sp]EKM51385.1 hypothetical protein PHACADRAFT_178020 [Phanerochaete carnosa HHB-10118-sp]